MFIYFIVFSRIDFEIYSMVAEKGHREKYFRIEKNISESRKIFQMNREKYFRIEKNILESRKKYFKTRKKIIYQVKFFVKETRKNKNKF